MKVLAFFVVTCLSLLRNTTLSLLR